MFWGTLEGEGKIVEALERHGIAVADSLKAKA
jgi:3-hydroxyacyl-CoA dehydrogenase